MTVSTNYWAMNLGSLLTGTLPKQDYDQFSSAMQSIYQYVKDKNEGRCVSKKLHNYSKRSNMIYKLFELYRSDPNYNELCRSKFMRKLVKHDRANDANLEYIQSSISKPWMTSMKIEESKQQDLALSLWIRDLYATIGNPVTLEEQKNTTSSLPPKYKTKLEDGRVEIGIMIKEAVNNKWLNQEHILEIVRLIELKEWPKLENMAIEFTEECIVDYFAKSYLGLIQSGGEHAAVFKQSLVTGLKAFSNDPVVVANTPKAS